MKSLFSSTVRVRLPLGLTEEDMPDFVSSQLNSYIDALDLNTEDGTSASLPADVRVSGVAVSDDSVAVNYTLPTESDDPLGENRVVMATRKGRFLVFKRLFGGRSAH